MGAKHQQSHVGACYLLFPSGGCQGWDAKEGPQGEARRQHVYLLPLWLDGFDYYFAHLRMSECDCGAQTR